MIFIWTFNEYLLHFGYVLVGYLHAGVTGQVLDRFLNKRQEEEVVAVALHEAQHTGLYVPLMTTWQLPELSEYVVFGIYL